MLGYAYDPCRWCSSTGEKNTRTIKINLKKDKMSAIICPVFIQSPIISLSVGPLHCITQMDGIWRMSTDLVYGMEVKTYKFLINNVLISFPFSTVNLNNIHVNQLLYICVKNCKYRIIQLFSVYDASAVFGWRRSGVI